MVKRIIRHGQYERLQKTIFDQVFLSLVMSKSMHMYKALYFLPHTCTKKLMSLSGYCVPVKCCMFLVSRITGTHKAHVQGFLDF